MRLILASVVFVMLTNAAHGQLDPYLIGLATTLRQEVSAQFGPQSTGPAWDIRQSIGNTFDFVLAPTQATATSPGYHPFLTPATSCFVRAFLLESMDQMIAAMDQSTPTATGLRVYHTTASGVILEAWLPDPTGVLVPIRVAMDFSDLTWEMSDAVVATCLDDAAYEQRINSIAARIHGQCISHIHPDHWSLRLTAALDAQGKPSYMPPLMALGAVALGFSPATTIPPPPGPVTLAPGIELSTYLGDQSGVQNNVYFLNFDVDVTPSSPTDGVTFIHFGDVNSPALLVHVLGLQSLGFFRDHVLVANDSGYIPGASLVIDSDVRFQTPMWELSHFVGGGWVPMAMPDEAALDVGQRLPLFWGESFHYPTDLP